MADADFYKSGNWNFFCDLCGRKQKSARAMFTWNGLYVCKHHKEIRNPQDFLRGVKDDQTVPWSRPEATDIFLPVCTPQSNSAIPGYAVPGCSLSGNDSVQFIQIAAPGVYTQAQLTLAQPFMAFPRVAPRCSLQGTFAIPGYAVPGCALSGKGPFLTNNAVPAYALSGQAVPSITW
jgi:hypothetical protein